MKHLPVLALLVALLCQCGPQRGAEFLLRGNDRGSSVDRFVLGQVEGEVVDQPLLKFASISRHDKRVFIGRARVAGTGDAIAPFALRMDELALSPLVRGRQYVFAFSGDRCVGIFDLLDGDLVNLDDPLIYSVGPKHTEPLEQFVRERLHRPLGRYGPAASDAPAPADMAPTPTPVENRSNERPR